MSFEKLLNELVRAIDETNTIIIDRITDPTMKYELVCTKPDLTYDAYYSMIKPKWDGVINSFVSQSDMCASLHNLIFLSKFINIKKISDISNLRDLNENEVKANIIKSVDVSDPKFQQQLQEIVFEPLAELIISKGADIYMDKNIVVTVYNFINVMSTRSICFMWDTLVQILIRKYKTTIATKDKHEVADLLRILFTEIVNKLKEIDINSTNYNYNVGIESIINRLTGIHSFTIESELNKMIPDKLASLKSFFIKTISHYYNNLHPIIWVQILRDMFINFIKDPPLTEDELFSFFSKHLLLNSGPFILKILQQVRPAMPLELMKKYNLTKLTYPVMTPYQYNLILSKVVKDWGMYTIDYDKSASVGHVFIVHRADTLDKFVVKLAKPISIVQSCWEYSILNDLFPQGSCEQQFVHNMLMSVGTELYSPNEVKNVRKGHELYTMNYSSLFKGTDLDIKLTAVNVVDGVIVDNCWYAFAMTLAPGIPVSSLVEGEKTQLLNDTAYRAVLHRCLDMLIFKFFVNIFQHGFYHGDLHAGNIYYSYEKRQMTLIDFGAVGNIDIYNDDPNMQKLIEIIIMSTFLNYDELLDVMTELINGKCSDDTKINMESIAYLKFKAKLKKAKIESIFYGEEEKHRADKYKEYIFSEERLNLERSKEVDTKTNKLEEFKPEHDKSGLVSPYSYIDKLKLLPKDKETVTDNTQQLAHDQIDTTSKTTSFAQVLAMITEFYAKQGVNIAIKFAEFYELMKAYVLLIGVLSQTSYPSLRIGIIMNKVIYDPGNLRALLHIKSVYNMYGTYQSEKKKYDELKKKIDDIKQRLEQQMRM